MRELKFRAWDKEKKKYLLPEEQGFVILPTKPSFGVTIPFQSEYYPNETLDIDCVDWADADLLMGRYELEQYTGLKDENGKEIYEGDIVAFSIPHFDKSTFGYDGETDLVGKIIFDYDRFGIEDKDGVYYELYFAEQGEVIGNIHENEELLETK